MGLKEIKLSINVHLSAPPALYSGGPAFKSQPGGQQFSMAIFGTSTRNLKTGQCLLLSLPPQFIIHILPTIFSSLRSFYCIMVLSCLTVPQLITGHTFMNSVMNIMPLVVTHSLMIF